jgi:hypothetical protein
MAYNSIPRPINRALIKLVPPTTRLLAALPELVAEAEVELADAVVALLVVVVMVVFGNIPVAEEEVEVAEVVFTVIKLAEIVDVEAEVIGPT